MKKQYFLLACLLVFMLRVHAQPLTAAPVPTANASNVLSLFGSHYTQASQAAGKGTWLQSWGQKALATYMSIGGDTTIKYSPLDYAGVQFSSPINVSTYDTLHLDIWTPSLTGIFLDLIATNENSDTIKLTPNKWNSISIPLTVFTVNPHKLGAPNSPCDLSKLLQFNFIGNNAGVTPQGISGTIYLQNIYFVQKSGKPTLGAFTVPAKLVGASPFTLTPPTSTSAGAFTYTSSNTNVATISGNTVTVKSAGSSLITATQAASGSYSAASTSATLVVSYPSPTTAAPVPTKNASSVISLFSDSYTNVAGTNFDTHWGGQNAVTYDSIQGNNTMHYTNFDFEGIQLVGNLDASKAGYLHVDIYTPDCAALRINLINTGTPTVQVGDSLKPILNQWTSFDIPLTKFSPVVMSKINQLMFDLGNGSNTVYIDNLYFWSASGTGTLPTISNFVVPSKTVGDAPFTLTSPTSNSAGAFTYTSSNLNVATISGNTVTIIGAGTTVITATQAASGTYSVGTITANLVVAAKGSIPTTSAPAPTANASNVLSVFGSHYTQNASAVGTDTWLQSWGQKAQATYLNITGDTTIKYSPLDYAGVQFSAPINVSTYDTLHLDIWTPDLTGILLDLIATNENTDTIKLVPGKWNSISIPLSVFTVNPHKIGVPNAPCDLSKLLQFNFIGNNAGVTPQGINGTIYLENVYFVQKSGKPTLGAFTIPNQLVGATPFTITGPTSTSTGSFTYTSSNTAVATISGNTVTIVGVGSTLITATQAAAGGYVSASTSATLVVSYPTPTTAAPTPTTPAANVISLFSDSYLNVAGTNFDTRWGGKNVVAYDSIQGNNTMNYSNFDFEGIQLTGSLDVSKATFLHVDIYTPDCASLRLNLINTTTPIQVGDTLVPTLNQWTSFDIPLSKFSPVPLNSINQLMFDLGNGNKTVYIDNLYFWDPSNILPVKLEGLNAVANGSKALITWKSVVEANIKSINIERSTNGNSWTVVTSVASHGNNFNYSVTDNNPLAGLNYYRLAITDFTGNVTYSSIVTVDFSAIAGISFFPNPVRERMIVTLPQIHHASASLTLVNLVGKVSRNIQFSNNNSSSKVNIDVAGLAKGVYMLVLTDGNQTQTTKVVIQ